MRPFTIDVAAEALDDLRERLAATRWPEGQTVDDWSQGVPLGYAREVAEYWADGYDWPARQDRMNRFDHVVTEVDGLDVHCINQRSPHEGAMPLLITHGWPGSVVEFDKVIEPLVDPTAHGGDAADAFHVVCPSLPGYGFSGKPTGTGWGVERIAAAWDRLMDRLGYDRYGAQGGDWGAAVTTQLGRLGGWGEAGCVAIHTNMPLGRPTEQAKTDPTEADKAAFAGAGHYREWDSGYSTQQRTRPQTLGYGLVDSPVGQMSWILEKFWAWTDCGHPDGHPENAISRDELLDNIMLYWLNGAGASSGRLYWESFGNMAGSGRVEVPTGVASFPREIVRVPRSWCEERYTITHWTDMERGGHFAAFEQPEAFVADVRTFFATVR
ncbi:MAG: epoxide hydrolase [Actinomycetota bacterium]